MKVGFVGFIGRPNVGKSTLMNMILGKKIAIMSPKPQTTRTMIQGIKTTDQGQLIFVDTPGVHKAHDSLGDFMNHVAKSGSEGLDVICQLFPADEGIGKGDQYIIEHVIKEQRNVKKIAVVTKIDLVEKGRLIEKIAYLASFEVFDEIIPLSAKKRDNLVAFEQLLYQLVPEGVPLYDTTTQDTQSNSFIIKEFIREKVLHLTEDELPHAIAVLIDEIDETKTDMTIEASIVVDRSSQKSIIIGKQGAMIREIRKQAERDLKRHFQKKIYLNLWVKVEKNWRQKKNFLHQVGYDTKDYD